ncbi:MAG: sulfotransferase family protein [Thermoplasmatota archaeon]
MNDVPAFIGIGVPKAGTTSLHHYLDQHPGIFMATKEPHYFLHAKGRRPWRGPGDAASTRNDIHEWPAYQAAFARAEGRLAGEFSPQYLADAEVPRRIKERLPDARFIAVLRDPVQRAYSNYLHLRRNHREPLGSFRDALAKEDERLAAGWEPFWGYRTQSRYGTNFQPWLEAFPRDRFFVLTLHELQARPAVTMDRLHDFLGVEPHRPDFLVHNPGGVGRLDAVQQRLLRRSPLGGLTRHLLPRSVRMRVHLALRRLNSKVPPLAPADEAWLRQEFLPEVELVERQFDLDLAAWKPT